MFASTHALSVYNALSLSGRDMTLEQVCLYTQEHGYRDLTKQRALEGLGLLLDRGFVRLDGQTIRVVRRKSAGGAAWPLIRTNAETDLTYA